MSPKPKQIIQFASFMLFCLAFITTRSNKRLNLKHWVTTAKILGVGTTLDGCASVTNLEFSHFTNVAITNKTVWLVTAGGKAKLGTMVTSCGSRNPVYYH